MKIWWKYEGDRLIKSVVEKEGWDVIETEWIDGVIPDGQGGVRVKTLEEKIAEEKERKLAELKENYALAAAKTDARILQYQKRKALDILTEDDESDYSEALNYYKKMTEQYSQKKARLEQINDLEELKTFDTSIT